MWLYMIGVLVMSALVVLEWTSSETTTARTTFAIIYGSILGFCLWRCVSGVLFLRRAIDRGWGIGMRDVFWRYYELPRIGGGARLPRREDWMALPSADPSRGEWENLSDAISLAHGWDAARARAREPVVVHVAESEEVAQIIRSLLQSEGFTAFARDQNSGRAYRFSWGAEVLVPAEELEAAKAFLEKALAEGHHKE